jgi:hypothetical protein
MEANLRNFLSVLAMSASVLTVNQSIAAQVPNTLSVDKVSVESIAAAKQELTKAASVSHAALKAKVKSLLGSSSAESIAVALSELRISPALQTMVEAGVPVAHAVGSLVAANTEDAHAIVTAALKIHPEAEITILQAAIDAGASPDDLLPATAAGRAGERSREHKERVAEFRHKDGEHGGGGGVITPPKPVSPD